jgi:hypothetical protein
MNLTKRWLGQDPDLSKTDKSQMLNLPVYKIKVDCAAISLVKKNTRGIIARFSAAFTDGLNELALDTCNPEYYSSTYIGMTNINHKMLRRL